MPFAAVGQEPQATLSITCECDCIWTVDGNRRGGLKKGQEDRLQVRVGEHNIEAKSLDGKVWKRTIETNEPKQENIRIEFGPNPASPGGVGGDPTADNAVQTVDPETEIPRFHTESRQILVGVTVWNHNNKNGTADEFSIPMEFRKRYPGAKDLFRSFPSPSRGLASKDFHVLDNDVEQALNYFKEADFSGAVKAGQWSFVSSTRGTWGFFFQGVALEIASATYLLGYVPPVLKAGECHRIKASVEGRDVLLNRDRYCSLERSNALDEATLEGTALGTRMRSFANSAAPASIKVSMRAFSFRSAGILQLGQQSSTMQTRGDTVFPGPDFKFVVEVHDSKAPATVQVATEFVLPYAVWHESDCEKNRAAVHVLGMVYKANGELVGQFGDAFSCTDPARPGFSTLAELFTDYFVPSRFDTQIELPPGEYDLHVVVSDGKKNFGRARASLRVERFDSQRLTISDLALSSSFRGVSAILRQTAYISPAPLLPAPLVSKNTQYVPDVNTQLRDNRRVSLYFEIYEPLLEHREPAVYFRLRVIDLKTGLSIVDTGPTSAAKWVLPGNPVIPIGSQLATDTLKKGTYRLEVQAADSAGRETEWRQAIFEVE
jgi:hypothetical protein